MVNVCIHQTADSLQVFILQDVNFESLRNILKPFDFTALVLLSKTVCGAWDFYLNKYCKNTVELSPRWFLSFHSLPQFWGGAIENSVKKHLSKYWGYCALCNETFYNSLDYKSTQSETLMVSTV